MVRSKAFFFQKIRNFTGVLCRECPDEFLLGGSMNSLIPIERIEDLIFVIRGHKVMVDTDLASIYGVTTKRLNEQVKRNRSRFPQDFMFQLDADEKKELVANCDRFKTLKHSTALPYVFMEHGAIMLASVLNSEIAVQASIQVVRAFVKLREVISSHRDLARKLVILEKKYDSQFRTVFSAIRQLMEPLPSKKRSIGFKRN